VDVKWKFLLAPLVAGALASCGQSPVPSEQQGPVASAAVPQPQSAALDPAKLMSEYVHERYDKRDYPKLARKIGSAWTRIQPLREAAALKAIGSGRCDFVELVEVSNERSSKEQLTVFVDCRNHERFYVTETDVVSDHKVVAQSEKTVSRGRAIAACAQAARERALFPSLVDAHTWSGATFQADQTTGGARVTLEFEATNALGNELPYLAVCVFPADRPAEISVTTR